MNSLTWGGGGGHLMDYIGTTLGDNQGDTRSLDYGSDGLSLLSVLRVSQAVPSTLKFIDSGIIMCSDITIMKS